VGVHSKPPETRASDFVVERLAGKLLGVRVGQIRLMSDWLSFAKEFRSAAVSIPGQIAVCADYRQLNVMRQDVINAVLEDFRRFNSQVQRSALLLPMSAPTLRLQVEWLLREAQHPGRRVCIGSAEVRAWLSPQLDEAEQRGLDDFLGADRQPVSST
jgi:hypothetical protein